MTPYGPLLNLPESWFSLSKSINIRRMGFALQGLCLLGPGNNWGNLISPPASKDAESPSNLILLEMINH